MGLFDGLGQLFGLGSKALDIGAKAVIDKDRLLQLAQEGKHDEMTAYVAELQARTFPLGDWIHKMGRQLTNWALMWMAYDLTKRGLTLDPTVWVILGGSTVTYSLLKGAGK